jgi:hypothetical protein
MKKSQLIAQIYGYLVCLVAVITFLICISTLVNALLDLGDPLHAGWNRDGSPSLASFDNYRMDVLKAPQKQSDITKASFVPDEQALRAMYNAAKDDKIQSERHTANKTVVVDVLLLVICLALFITHWRWMRKLAKTEA